jgi:hypothetical protein
MRKIKENRERCRFNVIEKRSSGSLRLKQRVEVLEFDAGIFGCELPVGFGVVAIAIVLPGGDFLDACLLVGDAAVEALRR